MDKKDVLEAIRTIKEIKREKEVVGTKHNRLLYKKMIEELEDWLEVLEDGEE